MLASVGVSVSHDPETDAEDLLREADVAMYRAKRAGGYGLELFDESLRREVTAHLDIETRLRHALPRSELTLDYQPIVSLDGGQAGCCEALVRWHPHEGTSVDPLDFLPRAEESELIVRIGDWVLNAACAQATLWHGRGEQVAVAVNISPRGLAELDLADRVAATLDRHGLPAEMLWLEVNENAIMRDRERAQTALEEVKRVGVRIALDGFGAGESRLNLLAGLPIDVVKIDRAVVGSLQDDEAQRAIVVGIVALARQAALQTVAVGIETDAQLQITRRLGCAMGQGFLLHPPAGADRLSLGRSSAIRSRAPWRLPARPRHRP
jgi:EAL domain-containing protein (putative c-di-GMP-specific phosphodiesterase class I)